MSEEAINYLTAYVDATAAHLLASAWERAEEGDLGPCPYFARCYGLPGHDPQATCYQMGVCANPNEPEPHCVAWEPMDGWPSLQPIFALYHGPADDKGATRE